MKRNSDKLEYMEEVFEKKCDGVAKLEGQYQCVADRIKLLDENLEDIEIKIEASTNLVEKLWLEKKGDDDNENPIAEQCLFDRKGFCREQENCVFSHTEEICEIYCHSLNSTSTQVESDKVVTWTTHHHHHHLNF